MKGNHVKKNKAAAHFIPKPLKGKTGSTATDLSLSQTEVDFYSAEVEIFLFLNNFKVVGNFIKNCFLSYLLKL